MASSKVRSRKTETKEDEVENTMGEDGTNEHDNEEEAELPTPEMLWKDVEKSCREGDEVLLRYEDTRGGRGYSPLSLSLSRTQVHRRHCGCICVKRN